MNKNINQHSNVDGGGMFKKPLPCRKNYRMPRNVGMGEGAFSREELYPLVIQHLMVNPENIDIQATLLSWSLLYCYEEAMTNTTLIKENISLGARL